MRLSSHSVQVLEQREEELRKKRETMDAELRAMKEKVEAEAEERKRKIQEVLGTP